jgi:hypothetical protein
MIFLFAASSEGTYSELQEYARRLLASFPEQGASGVRMNLPIEPLRSELERERQEEGSLTGCREAVELLTRNPRKGGCPGVDSFWIRLTAHGQCRMM